MDQNTHRDNGFLGMSSAAASYRQLLADGGVGKTTVRIAQSLALTTGRHYIAGDYVFVRSRVLYLCFEDDLDELKRRFYAAMLRRDIKPEDVAGYLFIEAVDAPRQASSRRSKVPAVAPPSNLASY